MKIEYMEKAIELAKYASKLDEVPVGCVIVKNNKIVGYGYNTKHNTNCATCHAEINAIEMASKTLNNWYLEDCEMYVTLEPCPMCVGAIIQSRISKLYFGAVDEKSGCVESLYQLLSDKRFNHRPEVIGHIMEEECSEILKQFFKSKRPTINSQVKK